MENNSLMLVDDPDKIVFPEVPDDDLKAAVADLLDRVVKLESELKRLQSATAHITSIQPIKG